VAADPRNILAGVSGLGNAFELAFFADAGATLPTDATAALDAGFKSVGIVTADGVGSSTSTGTNEIDGFGAFSPLRTLITSEVRTFTVTGEETNPVTLAIKSRLAIASAPTPGAGTGAVAITEGAARDVLYAAVFHAVDGANVIRKVLPSVRLTGIADENIAKAANIAYGFTFTAYPDSNGNSVYSYYILDAFAS
jgi:hypothetical protein